MRIIARDDTSRIPVSPFIHTNFVQSFFGSNAIDVIEKTVEVYEHFGFDIIHRNCTPAWDDVNIESDEWHTEQAIVREGRNSATTTVVHTPRGELRQVLRTNWVTEYDAETSPVEYLIKSEEDLDAVMKYQPPVGRIDTSPITRAKSILGDKGVTAPWVQGAFNYVAYYCRSLDELLLDAVLRPEFYHRMMSYFLERNKVIISQFIDAGTDMLSYAGNIASSKMVSQDFFMEYVFPYERQLVDFIQDRGVHVLYHNCGCARGLFRAYRELGVHYYESLTPPPYGDTDLEEAFSVLGPEQVLCGHIDQIDLLRTAHPDNIKRQVRSVLEKARRRGNFILGTSDYFSEDTPHENIHALAEAARE